MAQIYYAYVRGPVGDFLVAGSDTAVQFTGFTTGHQQRTPQSQWKEDVAPLRYAIDPLRAYFDGERVEFDVPLCPVGTDFQCRVWQALQAIGYGETTSYGAIARTLGRPGASRAVGAANAANHLPILVPCHRVIGADGSLTGFGGGLATKLRLLQLEGVTPRSEQMGLFQS